MLMQSRMHFACAARQCTCVILYTAVQLSINIYNASKSMTHLIHTRKDIMAAMSNIVNSISGTAIIATSRGGGNEAGATVPFEVDLMDDDEVC